MYGHKSPRTVRPYPYRNGSHIHRKGKEDLEEPGESHATPNHRPKEEVEAVTDLQREFNDYLDSFRSVVSYAAQIYGFYHEITHLTENMGEFTGQLKNSPTNALAVALSTNRNKIYRELIYNSIEIINDIRTVCLSDNKMTEKQRMEIVFGIRPKLQLMNKKLQRLSIAVKYTSMGDIWAEISEEARPKANKVEIARSAIRRWKRSGKAGAY